MKNKDLKIESLTQALKNNQIKIGNYPFLHMADNTVNKVDDYRYESLSRRSDKYPLLHMKDKDTEVIIEDMKKRIMDNFNELSFQVKQKILINDEEKKQAKGLK